MIRLKPEIETHARECPKCRENLEAKGFLIPGMRNLADLRCPNCRSEFFADLPSGQGLYTPLLIDKKSGEVTDDFNVEWFAKWLSDSYADRKNEPLPLEIKNYSKLKNKAVLLNCLDKPYGDSLLKLLNAQYYIDRKPDLSLIVLLPKFLEWLLPDGVSEAWVVDLPLNRGTEWNDWLANFIGGRLELFDEVFLSVAFPHPHEKDFDIERFTRVTPFENCAKDQSKPIVTYIWREDRFWETEEKIEPKIINKIKNRFKAAKKPKNFPVYEQLRKVSEFAGCLRKKFPGVDFAVAGLGTSGEFPQWITDLRLAKLNAEDERKWCERYAASRVVVGIQGSNMILPSILAGGFIDLVGENWWENYLQDVLLRQSDVREMFFRCRFVPHSSTPEHLARLTAAILREPEFNLLMGAKFTRHLEKYDFSERLAPHYKLVKKKEFISRG